MSLKSRSEYVTVLRRRYRGASDRVEKSQIIDELADTLGCSPYLLTPHAAQLH
jgi:hypothetical protein